MSVELQKLRSELFREALLKGLTTAAMVPEPFTTQLPRERIERWYKRLYSAAKEPLPVGARLINHFKIGADPEFVFHNGQQRLDAGSYNLKAGPAFGADNNARLCELRPAPSRSALSVLASTWLSMRWMAVFSPKVLEVQWRSGGYFEGDGLGGHVHVGRKRTREREREVAVLDRLAHLQFVAGIFDREEGRLRVRQAQGAGPGLHYGALGDVRLQPHGYEYRTLPSWIDNPWLAYFNLVASKLVVAQPHLVPPLNQADANLLSEQARAQLRLLLAYYAPFDDDARLAFAILSKQGLPKHASGLDFKTSWGLYMPGPLGKKAEAQPTALLPEMVPSTPEAEKELALSMFEGRPPECLDLRPNWPHELPQGYIHLIRNVSTKLAPGLGEWSMDLVTHESCPLQLINCGHRPFAFRFPVQTQKAITRTRLFDKMKLPADVATDDWVLHMNATKDFELSDLFKDRDIIVESGVLPVWRIRDVRPDSFDKWRSSLEEPKNRTGRILLKRSPDGEMPF